MSELHVVFGTGPLGLATMRALVKRGRQVRMINRSGKADLPAEGSTRTGYHARPGKARQTGAHDQPLREG